ncbi:MAG: bifunctional precorrin-2 dehydrogenase/sirohydrochlorin ferrochelatase [Gemmatimonadota bacterium]|jgi:siroheme synthase-like protein
MRFLPLALDVRGRNCLVVGGGAVGTRKARTLVRAGAHVTVVSPEVTDELAKEIEAGRVTWLQECFRAEHVCNACCLVVMATDNHVLNAAGALLATQERALACDASSVDNSQFIFGALLESDGVTVATFTDGRDPARARRVRDHVAHALSEPADAWPPPDVLTAR